ncbi:MAG: STAS domain-containing protein [Planctomycetota bacterium]|nr:STAS domain-containing protein [Planctomycetota bacterium]
MENQTPRLNVITEDDVTVVELTDRKILDEVSIAQIGEELSDIIDKADGIRLVLDFKSIVHMSSSALSMLITINKHVQQNGGRLVLCNISPPIHEAFTITRLNEVFKICVSLEKALAEAAS